MRNVSISAIALVLAMTAPAAAASFEVHMLNKGETGRMVFEPAITTVAVGDTVTFVPTDKGHNAETIPEILPAGGTTFKGEMNKEVAVTFEVAGTYGVKCLPHFGMGMVALVVVGDEPVNAELVTAPKLPREAAARFGDMLKAAAKQ
jgi:pseudoazurin